MLRAITPDELGAPLARYSHAMAVPAGARLVVVSGQLAVRRDGSVPDGVGAQAELIFANIATILAADGMSLADLVRINAYVTDRADMPGYMAVRDKVVADPPPASTLMIVTGFTRPEFRIEIEVIAARI